MYATVTWRNIDGAATDSPIVYPRRALTPESVLAADALAVLVVVTSGVPEGSTEAVNDTVADCMTKNTHHSKRKE
jgi:hypothetical protein